MSNFIDVSSPGARRDFRAIFVPRGAQSMRMYGVGRLAEYVQSLYDNQQSAYGMVRFYTQTEDDGNLPMESQVAGGHYEVANQAETGLVSELAFSYRHGLGGGSFQLLMYNLDLDDWDHTELGTAFVVDFRAVVQAMRVPWDVPDVHFGNFIEHGFADMIDLEDDPPGTGDLYNYYHGRGVPLPPGLTYEMLQNSVYSVWLWCLYEMRRVDPTLSNFSTPPDFPLMPTHFIGGSPMATDIANPMLSYNNIPVAVPGESSMGVAIREGGEEYGLGSDAYYLSGNVPTAYTEEMYDDLRTALDYQRHGGTLSASMRAVLAYAASVNNF